MPAAMKLRSLIAVLGASLVLTLAACAQPAPSAAPAPSSPAAATEANPPTPEAPACSGLTGEEALAEWALEVESDRPWDLVGASSDVSGYDECADLSWIVLRPESCCTTFEVTPIMFFHRGEFVPDATVRDRAFAGQKPAERLADGEIALTFQLSGGANRPAALTTIAYTWDEASGAVVAEEREPESTGSADGYWCPAPESPVGEGCVTIALPTATYDNGLTVELIEGGATGDGSISYSMSEAPFGSFYPAGVPIAVPDYYPGVDLPDEDRIWNGQTAVLLVRQ